MFRRRSLRARRRTERGLTRQFVYGGVAIVVTVLIGYGVWYVTRLPFFTIDTIGVSGGETIADEDMRTTVEDVLEGNYFFLIPRRFTYLYPHEDILGVLRAKERVRSVALEKTNRHTLTVTFTEYVPYALWCADHSGRQCVYLSEEGYAFTGAPRLMGGAFVRHVVTGRTPETGTQLFDRAEMVRIDAFLEALEDGLGFRVGSIEHTDVGDEVYHLFGGGMLLVAPQQPMQQTFDNLRSILESDAFSHLTPSNFEYIDLRFGNKVFVNEGQEPERAATTTDAETATDTEEDNETDGLDAPL